MMYITVIKPHTIRTYNHTTACTIDEFTCKSGQCIPQLAVCDEVKDCPQGDDEENCDCARNEVSKLQHSFHGT
jgi:hypothetical protein